MSSLISENNNHIFICGMTRSGKTYFATKALSELKTGVLFFNIQNAPMKLPFIKLSAENATYSQIVDMLKNKLKINLIFPANMSNSSIQRIIAYLSRALLREGFTEYNPIYLIYDECHTLSNEALKDVRQIATRGLYLGCRGVFISQRPALADLTLFTQSFEHYYFQLGNGERQYFKGKGVDFDECVKLWQKLGKHSYIYYDGYEMIGRKAV